MCVAELLTGICRRRNPASVALLRGVVAVWIEEVTQGVDDIGPMCPIAIPDRGNVARGEGRDQLPVHGDDGVDITIGPVAKCQGASNRCDVAPPDVKQKFVSTHLDDPRVEPDIGLVHAIEIARLRASFHLCNKVVQGRNIDDVLLKHLLGREHLEETAKRLQLGHAALGQRRHERASPRYADDESLAFQGAKRLAQRRPAHAELPRELRFHDSLTWRQTTLDDSLAQCAQHERAQRLAANFGQD